MIRASAILWGMLALGVGTGLFVLKFEVQALEDKLTRLNAEIRRDRAAVHVLEAEWSYLNDPARLRSQAERLLGMAPFAPSQVNTIAQLPLRPARRRPNPRPAGRLCRKCGVRPTARRPPSWPAHRFEGERSNVQAASVAHQEGCRAVPLSW